MLKKTLSYIALALVTIVLSNLFLGYSPSLFGKLLGHSYWNTVIQYFFWVTMVVLFPFAGLLPLIIHTLKSYPFSEEKLFRFISLHFGIFLTYSCAQILIHIIFEPDYGSYHGDMLFRIVRGIQDYFGYSLGLYLFAIAAYYAVTFFRQVRTKEVNEARLAETLANARLSSLKMKLQPHFIFNALQSINVLVLDEQNEPASEMLSKLSVLLRHSIDMDDRQLVTVERELESVEHYLAIEKIRFSIRLTVDQGIDPGVRKALIPGLILQPLIENAVRHGIARRMEPGCIRIEIGRKKDKLSILITDDGPGLPDDWDLETSAGFGLKTTLKRLELHYGREFEFSVSNDDGGGAKSRIQLPFSEELFNTSEGSSS